MARRKCPLRTTEVTGWEMEGVCGYDTHHWGIIVG